MRLAARLGGKALLRHHPQWSQGMKGTVHQLADFAAVVVFGLFVIRYTPS